MALLRAASPTETSTDAVFSSDNMGRLVKEIDEMSDPGNTRWLNAILGRIFYGLYRTKGLEEVSRPTVKAARVSSLLMCYHSDSCRRSTEKSRK